jgi:hypothetical protein
MKKVYSILYLVLSMNAVNCSIVLLLDCQIGKLTDC